jgi:hypothetical protein
MDKIFKQLLFILIVSTSLTSVAKSIEGRSQYFSEDEVQNFINSRSQNYLSSLESLEFEGLTCEFDYLKNIRASYRLFGHGSDEFAQALMYLRSLGKIDDTEYRLLSKSQESFKESLKYKFSAPLYKKVKNFKANAFSAYANQLKKGSCYTQVFKKLISDLGESKASKIRGQLKTAYHKRMIDKKNYWMLKRLVQNEFYSEPIVLSQYKKTQDFLDKQFPQRGLMGASDFISTRMEKSELSRRELLLSRYNQFQIVYMREMMEKLLNRLNADEVSINVVLDDYVMETIILDPMEQYRFAAKMIRKELGDLQNKSLFAKSKVGFIDLISAAYETGLVAAEDLEALATVEEVWNPALTKEEKRKKFIKRYGTIFVAALPTSIYFVKVLSLVGIEMLTEIKEEPSRDHSLF